MQSSLSTNGRYLVLLSLLLSALSSFEASGQSIRWEIDIPDPDTREMNQPYYAGVHLMRLSSGSIVATGRTRSNLGAAVSLLTEEGEVQWTHAITDRDSAVNTIAPRKGEIYLWALFSYENVLGQPVFFGHQLNVPGTIGELYILTFSADGSPIDTIAGFRDGVTSGDLVQRWIRTRDHTYALTEYRQFSSDPHYNQISVAIYDSSGRYSDGVKDKRWFYSPGKQFYEVQSHIPTDFVEASNGDFVTWGSAGSVGRSPYNIYRPFLHRVKPTGEEVYATNPASHFSGLGTSRDLSTTSDGGFVGLYAFNSLYSEENRRKQTESVVIRLDSLGNRVWEWAAADSGRSLVLEKIVELPDGSVVAAGWVKDFGGDDGTQPMKDSEQMIAFRLSSDGTLLWRQEWGEENVPEAIYGMLVLPDGDIIVNGRGVEGMYVARIGTGISSVEGVDPHRVDHLDLSHHGLTK